MRARLILLPLAIGAAFALGRWSSQRDVHADQVPRPPVVASATTRTTPAQQARAPAAHSDGGVPRPSGRVATIENLMYAQPFMMADSLKRLQQQTPGKTDLYAIGFAGDGDEPPFRNEVDYLAKLLGTRFGAQGRTLELVNSPATYATIPLATRTNLINAVEFIGNMMDRDNDVLFLFLTSHGGRDHRLFVGMGDLPLDQITPDDIRAALDAAHIRWRVVVVSACYSGGFIPALRDAHTMIITAARSDRTSFGCGNDSQITWFGKAFLTDALNRTTDFHDAYLRARTTIAGWEKRDGETPSEPQYWAGTDIQQKLDAWRATLPAAAAVPFVPASIASRAHHRLQ